MLTDKMSRGRADYRKIEMARNNGTIAGDNSQKREEVRRLVYKKGYRSAEFYKNRNHGYPKRNNERDNPFHSFYVIGEFADIPAQ